MNQKVILLIDDHAMFRAGLSMVVEMAIPEARIYEASSVNEAFDIAPDEISIVLLDIKLNGSSGLEDIVLIKRKWPDAPVLMLSSLDEPETVRLAIARGAAAFISKKESAENVIKVIQQLQNGDFLRIAVASDEGTKKLTPRQREVIELLHIGLSNKLIARKLNLSENTVRRHVQDILEYFQVANRAEAVFAARQQSLVG